MLTFSGALCLGLIKDPGPPTQQVANRNLLEMNEGTNSRICLLVIGALSFQRSDLERVRKPALQNVTEGCCELKYKCLNLVILIECRIYCVNRYD